MAGADDFAGGGAVVEILGIFFLGLLIGTMVAIFIKRAQELTLKALTGAISIFTGTAVLAIFNFLGHEPTLPHTIFWLYPIGLFLGFAVTSFFMALFG